MASARNIGENSPEWKIYRFSTHFSFGHALVTNSPLAGGKTGEIPVIFPEILEF